MTKTQIKEWGIRNLGTIDDRAFERLRWLVRRLLAPTVVLCCVILLSQQLYRYALRTEQTRILENALARAERMNTRGIADSKMRHRQPSREELENSSQTVPGTALEAVTAIALASGIRVDEVESGSRCSSDEVMRESRIKIAFTCSFSQMLRMYDYLISSESDLLVESIVVERAKPGHSRDAVHVKLCTGVVTKTSRYHEKLIAKAE